MSENSNPFSWNEAIQKLYTVGPGEPSPGPSGGEGGNSLYAWNEVFCAAPGDGGNGQPVFRIDGRDMTQYLHMPQLNREIGNIVVTCPYCQAEEMPIIGYSVDFSKPDEIKATCGRCMNKSIINLLKGTATPSY